MAEPARTPSPRRRAVGILFMVGALWSFGVMTGHLPLLVRGQTVAATVTEVTCPPWTVYQYCRGTVTYATAIGEQHFVRGFSPPVAAGDVQPVRYDPLRPERVRSGGIGASVALVALYGAASVLLAAVGARQLRLRRRWPSRRQHP